MFKTVIFVPDRYKDAFVNFIASLDWTWFLTIGAGDCPDDDEVLTRLRRIEAQFCKKYICGRYHKLPNRERFMMLVGFEGERKAGNRHAHVLIYVPKIRKKCFSDGSLISGFQYEFQLLWTWFAPDGFYHLSPWAADKELFPWELGEERYAQVKRMRQPDLKFSPAKRQEQFIRLSWQDRPRFRGRESSL